MVEALIAHYTAGNKAQFAKLLGVSPQTVSAWIARNTFDSELIYAKCRYLNASWLLTGEGSMFKSPQSISSQEPKTKIIGKREEKEWIANHCKTAQASKPYHPSSLLQSPQPTPASQQAIKQPEGSHEGIPLIPLSAMAGAFTSDIPVMEYECERYVIPAFKGADFLILVKGDSMQPTYHSGDLVACQKIPLSDIFFQWNKTYVLDTDQGPLIKRVRQATTADHVLLVSDNADYAPFELPVSALHAVALVRGIVRLE